MTSALDLDFHHLGLATRSAEQSARVLETLGYHIADAIFDPAQNVNLIWCSHETMPAVEVVYPAESPGPLDTYLADHAELIYHQCYETADIEGAVAALKSGGLRLLPVVPSKPAVLFGGRLVAFFMVKGVGLIELLQRELTDPHDA